MSALEKEKSRSKFHHAYNTLPSWYDIRGFFIFHLAYQTNFLQQVKFFAENLHSPHLEIAIGSGTFFRMQQWWRSWRNLPQLLSLHGIDYSAAMVEGAKNRLKNINLEVMDVENLQFSDDSFASISIANAAHCFANFEKSMLEIRRILRPSGVLIFNILLVPTGKMAKIAKWVNNYGMNKGILNRPYHYEEVINLLLALNFHICYEKKSGNTLNLIVTK